MAVGLQRATIFAIKEEVTAGEYVKPDSGTQFVPLRPGNSLSFSAEQLESDELLNDIGSAKSFVGKESSEGSHSAYLRHSGVEGQEPQLGLMYVSIMGDKAFNPTEYASVAGSNSEQLLIFQLLKVIQHFLQLNILEAVTQSRRLLVILLLSFHLQLMLTALVK